MPGGCVVTPAAPTPPTPPAPAAPAAPVTPQATPPAPTPAPTPATPVAEDVNGENAPTAGEEETPQGGVQGESDQSGPAPQTTPVATAAPGPSPEASAGELPFTGMNAWWLGLLGLTVAGTGVVLRRRSAE
jgi:LPXTG-motif cell wall-anchored protein